MNWPEHMVEQNEYFSEISNAVFQQSVKHHFRRAGSIRRPLSEPEKNEIIAKIEEAVPRVRNGETVEIRETSLGEVVYEMFLAPHEREDELTEWMEEHDVDGALSGPPQTKNDILRLKRSIAEKVKQIPPETPGVVLIEVDPMISLDERANGLLGIAKELLKDVYNHERLISVILLVRANSLDAEPIEVSIENIRVKDFATHSELGCRTLVTIHNKFVDDPKGKGTIDSIFFETGSTPPES